MPGLRSWLVAILFSVGSFVGTLAALNSPVEGATVRPTSAGKSLEGSSAMAPFQKTPPTPLVQSTQPEPPMVHLASEPGGASVRDATGNIVGTTPLRLGVGGDIVVSHAGYRDKRISLALHDQSVVVILGRPFAKRHRPAR
jgi:hypothetical protein